MGIHLRATLAAVILAAAIVPAGVSSASDTDPGMHLFEYTAFNDNSRQPYSVWVPASYGSFATHPVVIYLHGFGSRFRSSETAWSSECRSKANTRGWLLVSVDGRVRNQYDHVGELDVFQVLGEVSGRYAVDADRIYVYGVSMGGHGSYRLGVRFPDVFAAVAPVAGWTWYKEFVPHWYERCVDPMLPDYVDPSRKPNYELAGAYDMAENAMYLWMRIAYGTADTTNPPINAEAFIDRLNYFGYTRYDEVRVEGGGHGAGGDEAAIFDFFNGKTRTVSPSVMVYTTNRLKYGGAYWLRVSRMRSTNRWARMFGSVSGQTVSVKTTECSRITIDFSRCPVNAAEPVTVIIDGYVALLDGTVSGAMEFAAQTDSRNRLTGWTTASPITGLHKTADLEGPGDEIYLSPFIVVYGTNGSSAQNLENRHDAYQFTAQWNGWMILQWTSGTVLDGEKTSWYFPPYPASFITGAFMYDADAIQPVTDDVAMTMDLSDKNVILYGGPESNRLTAAMMSILPDDIVLSASGISVNGREYAGSKYHYSVLYPKHDGTDGMVLFNRGYLTSLPGLIDWGVTQSGKDFEGIAWNLPDYAVWDDTRPFTPHVSLSSTQFKDLTGQYVEAGYFDQDWRLDVTAPVTVGMLDPTGPALVLTAADNDGGSGVSRIECRVNGGAWISYTAPIPIELGATFIVEARSYDDSMQYLYEPYPGNGYQYSPKAAWNIELAKTWVFDPAGNPVSGDFIGYPSTPYIRGMMRGDIVAGVRVVISGGSSAETFTDSLGNFSFLVTPGDYTVSAFADGAYVYPANIRVVVSESHSVFLEFQTEKMDSVNTSPAPGYSHSGDCMMSENRTERPAFGMIPRAAMGLLMIVMACLPAYRRRSARPSRSSVPPRNHYHQ